MTTDYHTIVLNHALHNCSEPLHKGVLRLETLQNTLDNLLRLLDIEYIYEYE